jgi:hypothetical protein
VFSVVTAALVATQQCSKHTSAAVKQQVTIAKVVFSLRAAPRLYKKDLRQLELELRVSRVGSWQNNGKKGIRLCKDEFIVCCNY